MEALVEDIETKPSAQPAAAAKKAEPAQVDEDGTPIETQPDEPAAASGNNAQEDLTAELKKKFNIDAMTAEKEAEISAIVAELDAFKQEIDESQARAAAM